jgi:hypothetical protein
MKDISDPVWFHRIYPVLFSTAVLVLLIAFVPWSDFSPSALATNFRWRHSLVHLYTSFRMRLGDRVFHEALIGKDGWIFYTAASSIQDYQKTNLLDRKKLDFLQKELDRLSVDLRQKGITLVVVIPPNKSTIYPQYMPDEIPILGEESRLDQFVERMRLAGKTNLIDLRPALLNASKTQEVYFKVDTHWNDIGAYYGYHEILSFLSDFDSRLIPHPLSDYEYTYRGAWINPDLPFVLGIPSLKEEQWTLVPAFRAQGTQTIRLKLANDAEIFRMIGQDDSLPTLLVFHDSFYSAYFSFSHLMEPHFHKITGILYNSDPDTWSLNWIAQEKPDIVMIEIVERSFEHGLSSLLASRK